MTTIPEEMQRKTFDSDNFDNPWIQGHLIQNQIQDQLIQDHLIKTIMNDFILSRTFWQHFIRHV